MDLRLIAAGVAVASLAAFSGGWWSGYHAAQEHYTEQIVGIKNEYRAAQEQAEQEAKERYEQHQEKLSEALAARDAAISSASTLRRNAEQLRVRASNRANSLQESSPPGNADAGRLAQCERLLGEGVGLAGEGAELSSRLAADKSALITQLQ